MPANKLLSALMSSLGASAKNRQGSKSSAPSHAGGASKGKTRKARRRNARQSGGGGVYRDGGNTGTGSRVVGAPSSVGVVTSNSYFRMDGKAQNNTEYSGMGDSCRVVGCDLFSIPVATGADSKTAPFSDLTVAQMSPAIISPRLTNLEELYQYYAIRKLKVQYMPLCPTTTPGAIALGIAQNSDNSSGSFWTTQQQILEVTPSVLSPVWQSASTEYTHSGTKVWNTTSAGATDVDNYVQMLVVGVLAGGALSTSYGQLRLEYVIDFYKPTPVEGAPSQRRHSAAPSEHKSYSDFQRWLKSERALIGEKTDEKGIPPPTVADSRDCSSAAGKGKRKREGPPDDDNSSGFTFVDRAPGQSVKGLTIGLPKTGIDTPRMRTRSLERELK